MRKIRNDQNEAVGIATAEYDPEQERRLLNDPHVGLDWELEFGHTAASLTAVANYASSLLRRVVHAFIVGYDARMTQNALHAVLNRESYLDEKGEARSSLTGLDAVWLAEARIDKEQARRWGKAEVEFWMNSETVLDDIDIALFVPSLIGLGLWFETRQLIKANHGFGTRAFKLRAATRIAYALTRDPTLARDPNSTPMREARAYMKQHMSSIWLARGGASEAMHWLRLTE
jgi:hypothetical protein